MENKTKFCKHCGEMIDYDCIICTKCGKQVEELQGSKERDIIINNSASSSASASAVNGNKIRKMPWYIRWFWIIILSLCTGFLYLIPGVIMRVVWKSNN